jgi:hypothetical protein
MISPFHIVPNDFTPKQYGENGETEFGWSNNLKEWILQFFFQLVRTNDTVLVDLEMRLRDILFYLMNTLRNQSFLQTQDYKFYLILLYKLIGHTRDIINGKGERMLTYMMIDVWYDFFPELSFHALRCLNDTYETDEHSYGSWKDLKYFCNYCREKKGNEEHPLIKECIRIINSQLKKDYFSEITNISLVAKWIPREKTKKFGWIFPYLAYDYFNEYILSSKNQYTLHNAKNKCKMNYRKIISFLNKQLGTLQIKQCHNSWSEIDFNKITSSSMNKQKNAFLNTNLNSNEDRLICKENFKKYILNTNNCRTKINASRIEMNEFTKSAIQILKEVKRNDILDEKTKLEKELLNLQWKEQSIQNYGLGYVISMIDLSRTMYGEPRNAAIALGIRTAENSALGKRLILLSNLPKWVNFENKSDFVDIVEEIIKFETEMNSNLYTAFDLILDAIIEMNMEPENVKNISIFLFSDMQIDSLSTIYKTCMYDKIKEKYSNAGILLFKKPFKVPSIVLWNLRSTSGFPCLSTQPYVSMFSGYNVSMLNNISKKGFNILGKKTPWNQLENILNNKRYSILEIKAIEVFNKYFKNTL